MTVREFMLKKYPTNEYMDCPVPKHHWETIQEYADKYHEEKVKSVSSKTILTDISKLKDSDEWFVNNLKCIIDLQVNLVKNGRQICIDRAEIMNWIGLNL
jgi:hypothetical protein